MSKVVSVRLPDDTAERLKGIARREGRSVNEAAVRSIEEWLRQEEFAEIEFRGFNGERHACLKGALPVWQLVMVARGYEMDPQRTAEHFRWPVTRVKAALHYYEAYRQEIDDALADNAAMSFRRLKAILPGLERVPSPAAHATPASPELR